MFGYRENVGNKKGQKYPELRFSFISMEDANPERPNGQLQADQSVLYKLGSNCLNSGQEQEKQG